MAKKDAHPGVAFQVLGEGGKEHVFTRLDEAAAFVFREALQGGRWSSVYINIFSEAGARWWAGAPGAELFRSTPSKVLQEVIKIKVTPEGLRSF